MSNNKIKIDGDVQKLGYGNNTKRVIILNR